MQVINIFIWYNHHDYCGNTTPYHQIYVDIVIRPQFVDALFIVRLKPNLSMRRAVIINY